VIPVRKLSGTLEVGSVVVDVGITMRVTRDRNKIPAKQKEG
jgi:hypothetical protein